jgi:hypothetical protein
MKALGGNYVNPKNETAAIRAGLTEADFIVKDFTDALMIQVMDNENRETYGSSPASLIESVKAVVQALAKGLIPAFEIDPKINKQYLRYAPSYVPGVSASSSEAHPYAASNVAVFVGRARYAPSYVPGASSTSDVDHQPSWLNIHIGL